MSGDIAAGDAQSGQLITLRPHSEIKSFPLLTRDPSEKGNSQTQWNTDYSCD